MGFGNLSEASTFGARLDSMAAAPTPGYHIIRDAVGPNDLCLVWNWKHQVWGWDVDGDYRDRGWLYKDRFAAKASSFGNASRPIRRYQTSGSFYAAEHRIDPRNVRVVTSHELYRTLDLPVPHW